MEIIKNILNEVDSKKSVKDYDGAIALLERSIAGLPNEYKLYEELADIYLYIGNTEKALNALNFALSLNPESATGNYLKGFILLGQDKVIDAIVYLEVSNKLFGNNAEVLRNLGWAYTMSNEHDRGITILKRALNISPEDTLIAEDLAMALIGSGDIRAGNKLLKSIGKEPSV